MQEKRKWPSRDWFQFGSWKGGVSFLDQSQSKDEQNHGSPDCFRKLIENGSIGMIHVFKNCEFRKKSWRLKLIIFNRK